MVPHAVKTIFFSTKLVRCPSKEPSKGTSDFFSLHRGVRQGCPLSPYLFFLGAEILGNAVRRDTEIRGIKLGNSDFKLSQYVDDTTMILDGSERSFSRTFIRTRHICKCIRFESKL